jgi:DNA-binding NtrC family response regulator
MFVTKNSDIVASLEGKSASRYQVPSAFDPRDVEDVGGGLVFAALGSEMRKVRAQAEMLAQAKVPVLILGEPGTEKEAIARLIHKLRFGRTEGFRKVSCSAPHALDDGLSLQKLSTGSSATDPEPGQRIGRGTIFFDDLAALPTGHQDKLMHELQRPELNGGNGNGSQGLIRFVAAGEPGIRRAVEARRLREDLYEWVSTLVLHAPPLRHRLDEMEPLLQFTIDRLAQRCGVCAKTLPVPVVESCKHYSWPGNFRELEDFVRQYLLFGETNAYQGALGNGSCASDSTVKTLSGPDAGLQVAEQGPERNSFLRSIRWETERKAIAVALEKTNWNRKAAAHLLKVSYRSLLYKITQYKMTPPEGNPHPSDGGGPGGPNGEGS